MCNGADDDNDGQTDEDYLGLVTTTALSLSTDSPPARVASAPGPDGFYVAYSGYCLADGTHSDVFFNYVTLAGQLAFQSGPCAAVTGQRALLSGQQSSRHPALGSAGGNVAALVFTEERADGADLHVAELTRENSTVSRFGTFVVDAISSLVWESTDTYGGIAVGAGGMVAGLPRVVSDVEYAYAQKLTRTQGSIDRVDSRRLGASADGAVALAAVGNGYAAGWVGQDGVKTMFLDSVAQPLSAEPSSLARGNNPTELQVAALADDKVLLVWTEEGSSSTWKVLLARATRGDALITTVSPGFTTPLMRGYAGIGIDRTEVLLASIDETTGKLVLRRINGAAGTTCGSAMEIYAPDDAQHISVSVSGDRVLVMFRTGGNEVDAVNEVRAVVLERRRG